MKRMFVALVAVFALCAGLLAACALPSKGAFVYDEQYHWRQTDEGEVNKGAHKFKDVERSDDNGCVAVTETCSMCGYKRTTTAHRTDGYDYDKETHWQRIVCEHDVIAQKMPHVYENCVCADCGRYSVAEAARIALTDDGLRLGVKFADINLSQRLRGQFDVGADSKFSDGVAEVIFTASNVEACLSAKFDKDCSLATINGAAVKFVRHAACNVLYREGNFYVERCGLNDDFLQAEAVDTADEYVCKRLSAAKIAEFLPCTAELLTFCRDGNKLVALAEFVESLADLSQKTADGEDNSLRLFDIRQTEQGVEKTLNFSRLYKSVGILSGAGTDKLLDCADESIVDDVRAWLDGDGLTDVKERLNAVGDRVTLSFYFDKDGRFDKIFVYVCENSDDNEAKGTISSLLGDVGFSMELTRLTSDVSAMNEARRLQEKCDSSEEKCPHDWKISDKTSLSCSAYSPRTAICSLCNANKTVYARAPHKTETVVSLADGAETCSDGVIYTEKCTDCGTVVSSRTEYECVPICNTDTFGECGHKLYYGRCVCGADTVFAADSFSASEFFVNETLDGFDKIYDSFERKVYKCAQCGLTLDCSVSYLSGGGKTCGGRAEYVIEASDGVTQKSYTYTEIVDNHVFKAGKAMLFGESCEEGWCNVSVCVLCNYEQKSPTCYKHEAACGNSYYVTCPQGHVHEWNEVCCPCKSVCEIVAKSPDCKGEEETFENVTETKYDCGLETIARKTETKKGCYVSVEEKLTITSDSDVKVVKLNRRIAKHDFELSAGGSCEDCTLGAKLNARCATCGKTTVVVSYKHEITRKQEVALDGGMYELREICSVCGRTAGVYGPYDKESEQHVCGVTSYVLTGKSCADGWTEEKLCAFCGQRYAGESGSGHLYRTVYSSVEGATKCTDGCLRLEVCVVCGEEKSRETVFEHCKNTYDADFCDKSAVLRMSACPCGDEVDFVFRSAVDNNLHTFFVGKIYLFGKPTGETVTYDFETNTLTRHYA